MAETSERDLVEHIKKNMAKEYREDSIKWALINQGYSRTTIERAMKKAAEEVESEHKVQEEKRKEKERPKITYQLYDENNRIVFGKKPFWKRIFRR